MSHGSFRDCGGLRTPSEASKRPSKDENGASGDSGPPAFPPRETAAQGPGIGNPSARAVRVSISPINLRGGRLSGGYFPQATSHGIPRASWKEKTVSPGMFWEFPPRSPRRSPGA